MTDTGVPTNGRNGSNNDNDHISISTIYSDVFSDKGLSSSDGSGKSVSTSTSYETITWKKEEYFYDNPVFVRDVEDSTQVTRTDSTNPVDNSSEKQKCPLRTWMTLGVIGLCIIGVATWIFHNKYFLGSDNANDPAFSIQSLHIPGQCENDISTATIGEQICISYTSTQKVTSSPSSIHVRQLTSQYFNALEVFDVNVSSDNFVQQNGDWIVNYNSSRTDRQFRFFKETATCDNIGIYEITIEHDDGNITSAEVEIGLKDPKLQHSVTRINDSIHVHCEMTNTCKARYLDLIVNNGESSRLIPTMNECGNNDKKNSSTISADVIIPVSRFSGNQTISCVPLMTDPELAANLTSTMGIPVCEGADCVPNCKDDPHGIAYFQDKHICNIFYQCSNGDIILQNCSSSTYWSHSECTCVHFDDEICDGKTYRFFQPAMSFEKCTKA
ncbi:uncharacterized protein LOC127737591 [Mytilus californianus]|uniref:uncharacterized protein LOC127737591 n=1 Tax=Mytilus californianus TaxID=6549 RepID=UPI002245A75A|nr:uncharacterized protein LOC127737591 [Mytilus californianus]XP_052104383.1 uncharacterized protein LOC127737591 [Mytilus californianus]XP_052104384.1 uncharacterized protein LOC127737591 [Mytilus californianus]XP_052104385.1 uncharacterized protein LOC127737591 [Mytilus californianus]